jgi:hypothetical protein
MTSTGSARFHTPSSFASNESSHPLRAAIEGYLETEVATQKAPGLSDEENQRLRALGYLGPGSGDTVDE